MEYVDAETAVDIEAVALGQRREEVGAETAVIGVAVDDGVGDIGLGWQYLGQVQLGGVGVLDQLLADVGRAYLVGVAADGTVDAGVGVGEELFGRSGGAGDLVYLLIVVAAFGGTVDIADAATEEGFDFEGEGGSGLAGIVLDVGDAEIEGGVDVGEVEFVNEREGREAVGGVGDGEIGLETADGEVGDEGVEGEGAVGADTVYAPVLVALQFIV